MLEKITDCKNHCVCYADATTGLVEHKSKKDKLTTHLPIGGECRIERGVTVTILRRVSTEKLIITSYETAV